MSIEIILIPLAFAAAAAVKGKLEERQAAATGETAEEQPHVMAIETRMRDHELLARALEGLGCEVDRSGEEPKADYRGVEISFRRGEHEALHAHFEGEIEPEAAEAFLRDLDSEYSRLVQEQTYQRVVERSAEQGLELESERVEADNSIVLTLRVVD